MSSSGPNKPKAALAGPQPDWKKGTCYQSEMAHELMFHENNSVPGAHDTTKEIALALCGICEIRQGCLDYAIETAQGYGIWGGKTPRERRSIRRRQHAA